MSPRWRRLVYDQARMNRRWVGLFMGDRTGPATTRWIVRLAFALVVLSVPLFAADAQEQRPWKFPRIGLLNDQSVALANTQLEGFYKGLRDLGWVEGQNFTFERRYGEGKNEALPDLAADLVRLRVNVIVTIGTPATRAAKNATETIPIVFARVGDPVGFGLVRSLARPAGNLTGVTNLTVDLGAKRLELLREALPGIRRVGVLWDPSFPPRPSCGRSKGQPDPWASKFNPRPCSVSRSSRAPFWR